jgi:hypothetical protein
VIARKHLALFLGLISLGVVLLAPAMAQAAFGIESLSATAKNEDGTVDLQAGSHPFEYSVKLAVNQDSEERPEGRIRDVIADLPAGLVGDPQAVPRCTGAQFEGGFPNCPVNTQIGVVTLKRTGLPPVQEAIYNLTPPPGVAASVGFSLISLNSFQEASLRTGTDYGVRLSDVTVPNDQEIQSLTETIWGVPADPGHDFERGRACLTEGRVPCPLASELTPKPFLSLPTSCTGPLKTTVRIDSVEEPGVFQSKTVESLGLAGAPAGLSGCEKPPFEPSIVTQPETTTADAPTGLRVGLHIPQTKNPGGLATAHLKDTVVTLPAGLAINPSTGVGLGKDSACTEAQIGYLGVQEGRKTFTEAPAACPGDAKVGTVEILTPLLDHAVKGDVFLAKQTANPFGSLIALYITVNDPISGVIVKLPGKVVPDPVSGQLTATFEENPQLPFEDLNVTFQGGPRASLTTPGVCGIATTTAQLTPWTSPERPSVTRTSSFNPSSCFGTEAQKPNAPSFEAGTTAPLAGSYSPFVLKLGRENGSQHFGALNVTLPPGLTGKLAGVGECSEAQIAQARARSNPSQGALEEAQPSCPQSSALGTVTAGAGSGTQLYVTGRAYLAGPYKGAPLSMVIITPAVAGPFDLGTVVIRAGLYVDESSAQITVKSDPLPTILQGIPLDIRSVAVKIDRQGFTLNPTNCEAMAITGEEISTAGSVAPLKNTFKVDGCRGLDFSPNLALKFKGGTKRAQHPALRAVLTQPAGQANIGRASIMLPSSEFIDQNHIGNPCTRPKFNAGTCPPISVLGTATAYSPLLDKPLKGKVYFRANGGVRTLPDMVADLNGQIHVVLVGAVDAVNRKGSEQSRIRNTFSIVPDAPVSKFVLELYGGKRGVLVNSQNLCRTKVPQTAVVKMTGQNGKTHNFEPRIANNCGKKKARVKRGR